MYSKGAIILIPFPFTDLSAYKVRPALIISKNLSGDDIMVAFISSRVIKKILPTDVIIKNSDTFFKKTGLKTTSLIKINKIATLDKKIALGELGCISKRMRQEVNKKLKALFGL